LDFSVVSNKNFKFNTSLLTQGSITSAKKA